MKYLLHASCWGLEVSEPGKFLVSRNLRSRICGGAETVKNYETELLKPHTLHYDMESTVG